ncbi:MAG: hypothetical protein EBU06_01135 [Micrococcales bacterium]|nr:hypothetical protein [Micrococcales bacterium]NBT46865.1 hypothetical protein [Actinomycetota bacterium]
MTLRKAFSTFAAALIFTGLLTVVTLSSARAEVVTDANYSDQKVVGFAIKYRAGVTPFDFFGKQVALDSAGVTLKQSSAVGMDIWAASFAKPVTQIQAMKIADKLGQDPRIERIYLDHFLTYSKIWQSTPKLGTLKASSAPTSLSAQDAWSPNQPNIGQVRLSWKAPTKLNGGLIWGYRISKYDTTTASYLVLVSNTKSKATTALVKSGVTPGEISKFKVATITKSADSKYMAVSAYSAISSVIATAAPAAPVLQSAGSITSTSPVVVWVSQDAKDKGGLMVNYTVNASNPDGQTVSCTTTSNSCTLSGLIAGSRYSVRVTATNARGSATSEEISLASDPMMSQQWYLDSSYGLNVKNAWKITKGSPNVVVAVVDTGITQHPDLNDNVVTGYDFITSASNANDGGSRDPDPSDPGDYNVRKGIDSSWHGTHVAGIIAAASNDIGIVGIAPNVKIEPVRVLGINGGTESDIAAGINWAIGVSVPGAPKNMYPAKVVNLSIGSSEVSNCGTYSLTQLAINNAKVKDATLVTAAGNDNTYASDSYPGNCYGNITIGATGYSGERAYYSNFSGYYSAYKVFIGVDISAPGGDDEIDPSLPAGGEIWSTFNAGKTSPGAATYGAEEGTSMASPMAAGVVALMYSVKPNLTDDQAWEILKSTAKNFAPGSECDDQIISSTNQQTGELEVTGKCGIGIIDAGAAVAAAQKLK